MLRGTLNTFVLLFMVNFIDAMTLNSTVSIEEEFGPKESRINRRSINVKSIVI